MEKAHAAVQAKQNENVERNTDEQYCGEIKLKGFLDPLFISSLDPSVLEKPNCPTHIIIIIIKTTSACQSKYVIACENARLNATRKSRISSGEHYGSPIARDFRRKRRVQRASLQPQCISPTRALTYLKARGCTIEMLLSCNRVPRKAALRHRSQWAIVGTRLRPTQHPRLIYASCRVQADGVS